MKYIVKLLLTQFNNLGGLKWLAVIIFAFYKYLLTIVAEKWLRKKIAIEKTLILTI